MTTGSFREWVAQLEEAGDLVEIESPVSTEFEIAAYIKKSCDLAGPAFRFSDVEGHDMPVVGGLYGTKQRVLAALDVDSHPAGIERYRDVLERPVEPRPVDDGPVRTVIETEPDLRTIPIVRHSERDAGHYITAGVLVAALPHTGVYGQGIHRMMRRGRSELTIWAPEERRIGYAYRVNGQADEPTEVAIVIGASPAVTMGSITSVSHDVDKYGVAGAIQGAPIDLVECETVDLPVPADAELVIEGRIHPHTRVPEAPFGEVAGCYSGTQETPVVEVTGIMRREDPIYHTILTGFPPTENNLMQWVPRSARAKQDAERSVPHVEQATVKCGRSGGNGVYEVFVSIDKRLDGDPMNVICSVLGGRSQAKFCTVVDADVDLYDERQVNWALNTRVQPNRDVITFPTMTGGPLDPSGPHRQSEKMGIDATIPLGDDRATYERVEVPGTDEVDW